MNEDGRIIKSSEEHKTFAKNTFYSFFNLNSYYIFQIITSFIVARLITKELWGYLILALSYIIIITLISSCFPPALGDSIIFYIPRYMALKQYTRLKSFIKNAILVKLLFLIPIFFISVFTFQIFMELFITSLIDKTNLLYLLSPLIIIISLNPIFNGINASLDRYKTIFVLQIINYSIHISGLLFIFLYVSSVTLELIILVNICAVLIPFILNFCIIIINLHKIKNTTEERISFKEFSQKAFRYGIPINLGNLAYGFWKEGQIQGIGALSTPEQVTGYNIACAYSIFSEVFITSLFFPLFTSFSRLNVSQDDKTIKKIYKIIIKYSLFILLLTIGFMYFLADFFLFFVFGESYLVFSSFLRLLIISKMFNVIYHPFDALLMAKNKATQVPVLKIIRISLYLCFFFIGLIFFGIFGAIYGIIFGNVIALILYIILSYKILEIKIDLKKLILQYLIFFITLGIVLLLNNSILNEVSLKIQILKILLSVYLPILSMGIFLLIFLLLNISFKIFSRSDFEILESVFNRDNKIDRIIRKFLHMFKKLIIFSKN